MLSPTRQTGKALQGRQVERAFLVPVSICESPTEDVSQTKGVCHHTWILDLLVPDDFELNDLLALVS